MKYYIESVQYFDRYGEAEKPKYYIFYFKKIIFWKFKKYIRHSECYESGCASYKTTFKNYKDAERYIKNTLCCGCARNKHIYSVINSINCDSNKSK